MPDRPFHVAKFGGTSVGTPERVRRAVALAMAEGGGCRRVVVSSAFGGVTDRLLDAIDAAVQRTGEHRAILAEIRQRHDHALGALAAPADRAAVAEALAALFTEVGELLYGVYLLRECTPRFRDAIVSAGERASVPVVAAAFRHAGHDAVALDATAFVRTDDAWGEAAVDFETTGRLARAALADVPADAVAVVTGFVASTADGVTTTLGRSGSDYTATILAGALGAASCTIWTDVDGVLSADPRVVPEAFSLPRLSYQEAAELAHFGAKVLHPRTMRPLAREGIPLQIKNTLRPEARGTEIGPARDGDGGRAAIRAITAVRDVALVRVEGQAVLETAELGRRVLEALAEASVPVYLVAQASAEGSFGLAVRAADADRAADRLRESLATEIGRGDVGAVRVEPGGAVVAAVGSGMHGAAGLAGRFFATLARAHVNARAMAQGGGDHTISAVVADAEAAHAVGALHEAFALRRLRAHVVVVGVGALGRRVLALLADRAAPLRAEGVHLVLAGVADSQRLAWDPAGLDPAAALGQLADAERADLAALSQRLAAARLERLVVVDATPSPAVAARHPEWLRAGVAVVTPNKQARRGPGWTAAQAAARDAETPYLYESAVGAGLGVVGRLRDLVRTGDRVESVGGVLSGTLSFVMNRMRDGAPFSEAVAAARDAGLTEPDVRDDLSGRDVARKLALLAREVGIETDPDAAAVESLVPEALAGCPLGEFWRRLPQADAGWAERLRRSPGELQYAAWLDGDGAIRAAVEAVGDDQPVLRGLRGSEIAVEICTRRSGAVPVSLRGPGATADVTAAVVLADVVRAAEAMR